jgi:hypothetical protein
VPAGQEAAERGLLGRLDLLAQRGERGAAQATKDVGIAPLALDAAGTQLAAHELLVALELAELRLDVAPEVLVRLRRRERPPPFRIPVDELLQCRVGVRPREKGVGQPTRRHHAERVAVAARVLRREQPLLAREPDADRATLTNQRLGEAGVVLAVAQVAAPAQDVVQLVGVPRTAAQLRLDLVERTRVDQVA